MNIIKAGHVYELEHLDGNQKQTLSFVNRNNGCDKEGTYNQEVLRVLIDRVIFLDKQVPWSGNIEILQHLRMALALHEARAFLRKVEKKQIDLNTLKIGNDGHFIFINKLADKLDELNK